MRGQRLGRNLRRLPNANADLWQRDALEVVGPLSATQNRNECRDGWHDRMAEVDRPLIAVTSGAAARVGFAAGGDNDFVGQKTVAVSFNFETRRLIGGGYVFDRSNG